MKIAAFPNNSGSTLWRLTDPFKYLMTYGHEPVIYTKGINEKIADWADVYLLQSVVDKEGIALLHYYQKEKGKKIVLDIDDDLNVQDDNIYKDLHRIKSAPDVIQITAKIADLIFTTNGYLSTKLQKLNKNVTVVPNYLDLDRWDLPKYRNDSKTIRLGWAGSMTHLDDVKMVQEPLMRLLSEFKNLKLIIAGDHRVSELFRGANVEGYVGVPLDAWPSRLHGLRLDIGIAPLRDTEFNRCKSNIKWLEYSIAKIPGVYSPTVYSMRGFDEKLGILAKNPEQWYSALKNLIQYEQLREDIGHCAYTMVKKRYNLKSHAHLWNEAYMSLVQ